MLRQCASCGTNLPAGATARAKFCSATCRKRASRATEAAPLTLVSSAPSPSPTHASRLEALESTAARLDRLLDMADPRSAAQLNREYRETLREVEALRAEAGQGGHERSGASRRPFSASAI